MGTGTSKREIPYEKLTISSHLIYSGQTIASKASISNPSGGLTISKPGYYPIGIVGWSASGASSGFITPGRLYTTDEAVGSCKVYWNFQNNADSQLTGQGFSVRILWYKV